MIVTGLDEKQYKLKLESRETKKSKLHLQALELLKSIYPYDKIYEDVTLPGSKTMSRKSLLYVDLYLPNRNLMVEVHGEQHFKYNSHFYKDKHQFFKAKARDRDKLAWCDKNGINIIVLGFDNHDEWENIVVNRG